MFIFRPSYTITWHQISNYFRDNVNLNKSGIYRFAEGHNIEGLRDIALDYIHDNFYLVSLEEEFHEINKELLSQFISSEYLRVDSEYQVFCATMDWINYDIANRSAVPVVFFNASLSLTEQC